MTVLKNAGLKGTTSLQVQEAVSRAFEQRLGLGWEPDVPLPFAGDLPPRVSANGGEQFPLPPLRADLHKYRFRFPWSAARSGLAGRAGRPT
jgi:hypothetical protein